VLEDARITKKSAMPLPKKDVHGRGSGEKERTTSMANVKKLQKKEKDSFGPVRRGGKERTGIERCEGPQWSPA